jgi:hypothetical protein
MGDEHDGSPTPVKFVEKLEDVVGRHRVEVAGRLIGQDERRVGDQGASHRHTLLLTSGQFAWAVFDPVP